MAKSFKFRDENLAALRSDISSSAPDVSISDQTIGRLQADYEQNGGSNHPISPMLVNLIQCICDELIKRHEKAKEAAKPVVQPVVAPVVAPVAHPVVPPVAPK